MVSTAAAAAEGCDSQEGMLGELEGEEGENGNEDEDAAGLECPEHEPESQEVKTGPFTYKPTEIGRASCRERV